MLFNIFLISAYVISLAVAADIHHKPLHLRPDDRPMSNTKPLNSSVYRSGKIPADVKAVIDKNEKNDKDLLSLFHDDDLRKSILDLGLRPKISLVISDVAETAVYAQRQGTRMQDPSKFDPNTDCISLTNLLLQLSNNVLDAKPFLVEMQQIPNLKYYRDHNFKTMRGSFSELREEIDPIYFKNSQMGEMASSLKMLRNVFESKPSDFNKAPMIPQAQHKCPGSFGDILAAVQSAHKALTELRELYSADVPCYEACEQSPVAM